ncbi:DUF5753 domain-containing protein, partial [Amycolatopsis sp.]|uniref:DUF5753 domain-containing protein n=1 Tax=Amycolatopsis sp. TaxID=37632 RepID=UPI002E0B570D|nr:DUF5753 domain-containing protein [Amycolatopsis sp.]
PPSEQLRTYIAHETQAIGIRNFQLALVPGLLQTEDYARAVISRSVNVPSKQVEVRVHTRMLRQEIFNRYPRPDFTYFLHESALRLPVGGSEVMSEQLHHLLRMAIRPNLELRIVPCSAGAHAGTAGPFTLMEFPRFTPVIYLEGEMSSVFLEQTTEVAAYRRILASLADTALGPEESKQLLVTQARELYSDREDQHDLAEEQLQRGRR